jgi:hypothetical protein
VELEFELGKAATAVLVPPRRPQDRFLWAAVSLACGALGCVAGLAFVAMAERYGEIANRSAGIGAIWLGMPN